MNCRSRVPHALLSWKLKRKAISPNDAEVQTMVESEDANFRVRPLWREEPGEDMASVKGILTTGSKKGEDAITLHESPTLALGNMRAALQTFQAPEQNWNLWAASDCDLGDALTKTEAWCGAGLLQCLHANIWAVTFDPLFTSAKKNAKAGVSAVQRLRQAMTPEPAFVQRPATEKVLMQVVQSVGAILGGPL